MEVKLSQKVFKPHLPPLFMGGRKYQILGVLVLLIFIGSTLPLVSANWFTDVIGDLGLGSFFSGGSHSSDYYLTDTSTMYLGSGDAQNIISRSDEEHEFEIYRGDRYSSSVQDCFFTSDEECESKHYCYLDSGWGYDVCVPQTNYIRYCDSSQTYDTSPSISGVVRSGDNHLFEFDHVDDKKYCYKMVVRTYVRSGSQTTDSHTTQAYRCDASNEWQSLGRIAQNQPGWEDDRWCSNVNHNSYEDKWGTIHCASSPQSDWCQTYTDTHLGMYRCIEEGGSAYYDCDEHDAFGVDYEESFVFDDNSGLKCCVPDYKNYGDSIIDSGLDVVSSIFGSLGILLTYIFYGFLIILAIIVLLLIIYIVRLFVG